MDPTLLTLVDSIDADDSDIEATEEVTSPLHGLQEYFDKQFADVQLTLTQKFEKASALLARRIKVLRTMSKQHVKLQEENQRLADELKNLRKMISGSTGIGSPQSEPDLFKPGAPSHVPSVSNARRNSFHHEFPSTGLGRRNSHSNEKKRPGTPPTGNHKKGSGPVKTSSIVFSAGSRRASKDNDKSLAKDLVPLLPVLPGLVNTNNVTALVNANNGAPPCNAETEKQDATPALCTTAAAPIEKIPKSPLPPDSPKSTTAPAFGTAPVLAQPASASPQASCSNSGSATGVEPPPPAMNNFTNGDELTKEPLKGNDPQLIVTDLWSHASDSDNEKRTSQEGGERSENEQVHSTSEGVKYGSGKTNEGGQFESMTSRLSTDGRLGCDAELVKRASIDRDILLRHSETSEGSLLLKRSDSAPLEDIVPPSSCNSPTNDPETSIRTFRSRTASILKPPGSKRGTQMRSITIAPVTEYDSEKHDGGSLGGSSSSSEDGAKASRAASADVMSDQTQNSAEQFEVLQIWSTKSPVQLAAATQFKQDLRRRQSLRKMSRLMFDSTQMGELLKQQSEASWLRMLIPVLVHPNSLKRAVWDVLSFVLLIYDMITIPFELFDPPPSSFGTCMMWTARIFWSCDMWFSCITGYIASDGSIEMRPNMILTRYARSWFILDVILVGLDWAELFWVGSTSVGFARLGKASRAFRILRMLRMLRVIRLNQVIQLIDERIRSDRLMIFADIVKILLIIVGCAHFIACVWYGIGARDEKFETWVAVHLDHYHSLSYRYFLSMHWSLSQFAGGMDEVVPHNLLERVFAVSIWISAFMLAAVLTSSLTSEITRLQIISNQHAQQLSILRRFLSDNGVSNKLSVRVQRNARHVLQQQQRYMRESSVELLELVSEPLRIELHFEIYSPLLCRHPFFNEYIEECSYVMRKVCHSCALITPVFCGDVLFNAGESPRPPKMYFILSGVQEYFTIGGNQVSVREGQWLAEATLWTTWIHRGGLRVKVDSQLCEFSAERFQEIVADSDFSLFDPRRYAEQFVRLLNTYAGGVSDLPFPRDVLEDACGHRRYQSATNGQQLGLMTKDEVMGMARTSHGS